MSTDDRRPPLVGRAHEQVELGAALADARQGHTRFLLLTGEPGIGKTRLADEIARLAAAQGFAIFWGRCREEEGAPAYWPWVQVLEACLRVRRLPPLAVASGPGGKYLRALVPNVRWEQADLPARAQTPAGDARFYLFDAVARCLREAAAGGPMLVILDDLHAADDSSLLLLRFVVRELRDAPVCVVATYRELEASRGGDERTVLFAELARDGQRLPLGGLSEADVATFIDRWCDVTPSPDLVRSISEATDGNPFFVDEMVRLLRSEGRLGGGAAPPERIPHGVRTVLRSRLRALGTECRRLLATAAIIGRQFDVVHLEAMSGLGRDRLLALLDEARASGILTASPDVLGRYAFAHALIRETLYLDLPAAERVALHRCAGDVLETLHGAALGPYLAEIAHHYGRAALGGDVDKAIDYALRAGERAAVLLAYEQAAAHYEQALQTLAVAPAADAARRCEIQLAIGETRARAGDRNGARTAFLGAAGLARRLGHAGNLARAALGLGGPWVEIGSVDVALVGLLEEAIGLVGSTDGDDGLLRARLMARLARELYWSDTPQRGNAVATEAVALARRLGDPATLAAALTAHVYALWAPDRLEARIAAEGEIVRLAEATGDKEMALRGRLWRMSDLLELGDIEVVEREMQTYAQLAEELRQPAYLWYVPRNRAMRALLAGHFTEAEALAREAFAIGERAHAGLAAQALGVLTVMVRWERGELAALAEILREFQQRYPSVAAWQCGLAFVLSEQGRLPEARAELERLAARRFTALHRDATWLLAVALLALACANLDDAARARDLYALLEPYAERSIVVGRSLVCFGAASHYLGLLATVMRRWDAAATHLEAALHLHERLGARPWLARSQLALARMLALRGAPDDGPRIRGLLDAVRETAAALGMGRLAQELAGVESVLDLRQPLAEPAAMPAADGSPSVFRREGDFWTVAHEGVALRLKDSRGLHYLACLLRHPHHEFHALELVAVVAGQGGPVLPAAGGAAELGERGIRVSRLGDAGEVLDPVACGAYRRRIEELRSELEEATSFNDTGRATRAREEIEFLTDQLAQAVGLGGRGGRRAASSAERARVNVTKQVRGVITRIAREAPRLGEDLRRTIRTGLVCSYDPDPRTSIDWSF